MQPPFALIETMRAEDGVVALWPLHRARLLRSAEALGAPLDAADLGRLVAAETAGLRGLHRVRLLVGADGGIGLTVGPLGAPPPGVLRVCAFPERVASSDFWLRHKTTRRERYEAAYAAVRARGFDEALFANERGELTEGSRTNVYLPAEGLLLTPPEACGLLPGVYRRRLLEAGQAREAAAPVAALRPGARLLLSNAVWGLREAVLAEGFGEEAAPR